MFIPRLSVPGVFQGSDDIPSVPQFAVRLGDLCPEEVEIILNNFT